MGLDEDLSHREKLKWLAAALCGKLVVEGGHKRVPGIHFQVSGPSVILRNPIFRGAGVINT